MLNVLNRINVYYIYILLRWKQKEVKIVNIDTDGEPYTVLKMYNIIIILKYVIHIKYDINNY